MTAWDANGMEREPFGERDYIRNPEYETEGRHQAPALLTPGQRAHAAAVLTHGDCSGCQAGKGYIIPGPPHCETHDAHCSAEACW